MYNLLIAFTAGLVVTVAVRLAGLPLYAGVVPGILVFVGAYVLLARRIMKKLQAVGLEVQNELKKPINFPASRPRGSPRRSRHSSRASSTTGGRSWSPPRSTARSASSITW